MFRFTCLRGEASQTRGVWGGAAPPKEPEGLRGGFGGRSPPKTSFFSLTPAENRHFHQPFFTFEREVTWAQSDLLHEWRLDPRPIPAPRTGSAPIPAIPERVPILAISMGHMPPALPRSDVPEQPEQ